MPKSAPDGSKKYLLPVTPEDIRVAEKIIRPYLPPSPLIQSPSLTELLGRDVYLKWESKLITGSFKERGALHFLLCLSAAERSKGVCAASAGNHGLALSYYASKLGITCHLVMPVHAPLVKVESCRKNGAQIILHGKSFNDAYQYAQTLSKDKGFSFVPAFDSPKIIAGQGSVGLEILSQLKDFDAVIVPVGGGGLMSGIALAIAEKKPKVALIGVQSTWVTEKKYQLQSGSPLSPVTIADGIAVKTIGTTNAPILSKLVPTMISVSENEVAQGIVHLLERERSVVEGAGAAGVAALLAGKISEDFKRIVIVVSGSNIDMNLVSRLIEKSMAEQGRLVHLSVSVPDAPGSLQAASAVIASAGANVLQVFHERSFSVEPGNVDVSFQLEVRDTAHKDEIVAALEKSGLEVREIDKTRRTL